MIAHIVQFVEVRCAITFEQTLALVNKKTDGNFFYNNGGFA